MTSRLVLVRHARAASTAGPDLLRPLTDAGERQAIALGERMRSLGDLGPVLCSPAARCIQTAYGILQGLGRSEEPDIRPDLGESSGAGLTLEIALAAAPGTIVVGHQPSLVDLACALLHQTSLPFTLAPAAGVVLHGDGAQTPWSVGQLLPPP